MLCHCYHSDPPSLVAALIDEAMLRRYQAALGDEVPGLADRAMLLHLRRLGLLCSQVLAEGFERVAARDLPAADALLTDCFAVATWHGWELPVEPAGERDLPVEDLPRGLLGADASREGALLWLLDDRTLALSRSRLADDEVVMDRD